MAGCGESSRKRRMKSVAPPRKMTRSMKEASVSESRDELEYESEGGDVEVMEVKEVRPIITETMLDSEFMRAHQLSEVLDLLSAQGWGHLFCEEMEVNEEDVRNFYQNLIVEERGGLTFATFTVKGETEAMSHKVLAKILRVPVEGYGDYVKGVWPSNIVRAEVILRVGEDPTNDSRQGNALRLGIVKRTLHRLVCTSVLPRSQKHGTISLQDFLVLDKILLREQVSLPKLILRHMQYCISGPTHGLPYPGIVKKILMHYKMYSYVREIPVSTPLNMEAYEKLSWRFEEGAGWSNARVVPAVVVEEEAPGEGGLGVGVPAPARPDDHPLFDLLTRILGKLNNMEMMMASTLTRDSADRVNLTAAMERNTTVLTAVLGSIKKKAVLVAGPSGTAESGEEPGAEKESVEGGTPVAVPVVNQPSPVNE